MSVVFFERNLSYLPKPNEVEVILSGETSPPALTATAFIIPVFDDGGVLLAVNKLRGLEIAGGHVEPDESLEEAAAREGFEEVGCTVADIVPIGFLRMNVGPIVPDGYKYPFPISYQQFFAGRVGEISETYDEDRFECFAPTRVRDLSTLKSPSARIFCERAREVFA